MSIDVEQLRAALNGQQSMASLFSEHPNPVVRMLAEQWTQRATVSEEAEPTPAPDDRVEQTLRRRIARLQTELTMRDDFLGVLAGALGACEQCWGEDTLCTQCQGRGRPAWRLPDPEQFERFIAPAARRLASSQRALRKSQAPTIQRNPPPTQPSTGEAS